MRVLLLTMLDLGREQNQRTQHVARMVATIADEVVVVSKVQSTDRSWRGLLRDVFHWSVGVRRDGTTTTLALRPPLNYAQALAAGLVHGGRAPGPGRRLLAAALSLAGVLRDLLLVPSFLLAVLLHARGRFAVGVVDGPWTGVAALLLRRLGRLDRVVYDDIDCVAGGQMLRLRRAYVAALERRAIAAADLTICAGWRLGELRRATSGRVPLVIPNGVDPGRFVAPRRPHPPTLVFVGRLAHYVGLDLLLRALPAIRAALPEARLLVVGDGDPPYVAGLGELAVATGVAAAVEFRGPVAYAGLAEVLAEADVGVVRFRLTELTRYAFPLKTLEYFAAGLAVLGARGTDVETLLERYPAGRAVEVEAGGEAQAIAAIAAAAIELLADPAAAATAVIARRAAADFTWEAAMRREREAIEALLASALPAGSAAICRDAVKG